MIPPQEALSPDLEGRMALEVIGSGSGVTRACRQENVQQGETLCEQQWSSGSKCHHSDVHCHRPGCCKCRRIFISYPIRRIDSEKDLYLSITIPSLIVATYGGGTGLPTQRECLEVMDCYGEGKVRKLAEIVAGVALAGEISLAAAISSLDWVSSHEALGRNR